MSMEFYWTAVAIVTVISVSRVTRLLTWDKFPPALWLREKFADATDGSGWELLVYCGYCMSFWVASGSILWASLAGVYEGPDNMSGPAQAWWIASAVLAASYLAAVFMANDGDDGDDSEDSE